MPYSIKKKVNLLKKKKKKSFQFLEKKYSS